ncbi:NADH-quinone oxidoreductase subunit C [Nonomuraea angiospora]|uniref:Ni,Fe-hydrogenase III large subunit/Ni,Fe-hydrogenase III component G n=1 Tax=Nonomuraea angiospora TaxID=46172 RepID=A0ABR9M174_9ACTN|nr:NADH-quinone oxidoreductase subunit C [Nonomuraea angiospora]MBE1586649.1 Ni,Fe-hydrogenase III large subunit/Ni,Fe-hydrogenase III component G [Nonomuraea angiospora]
MSIRTVADISPGELLEHATRLLTAGHRLALVSARQETAGFALVYLFVAGSQDRRTELRLRLQGDQPEVPSLAQQSFPAGRFEREIHDLYGITPLGHPLLRRLVRHHHWPRGWYPMRADAGPPPSFGDPEGPYPFVTVEGQGVYEIPVGPVHAGLIEPGHFRFSVVGETIIKLKARLWFVHKGIEKLFEGRRPADGLELAERVSGDTCVGHALAYCLAVEEATQTPVTARAQRDRAVLLELERLYNHVTDLGALCNDVAFAILHAHAGRIREQLLRLNAEVTGHRLLRGGVRLGGADLKTLPDPGRLHAIGADMAEIIELALRHTVVADRFAGTAVLSCDAARDLGTLGYVARASGLDLDARRDHPFTGLGDFTPARRTTGDVLARFQIRAEEIAASIALITHLVDGPIAADASAGEGSSSGVGLVEGWRGTIAHRIELAPDDTLARVKIVDPSFFNWPALPVALNSAIVPDFPLVNKSFNLSYAGNDL